MKFQKIGVLSGFIMISLLTSSCLSFLDEVYERGDALLKNRPENWITIQGEERELGYYRTDPVDGPRLLFIHGSPGSWKDYSRYLSDPDLTDRLQILSMDRPGYGGSGSGKPVIDLKKQAAAVGQILENSSTSGEGQPPTILLGHSYGGAVALRAALDFPGSVDHVIVVAGSVSPELEERKWYQYPARWPIFRWMVPEILDVCNEEIFFLKPELEELARDLKRLDVPVTILQGDEDELVPPGNGVWLKEQLTGKDVELMMLPSVDHFIPWKEYSPLKREILNAANRFKR